MPRISVIVPVYKVETYLRECVDSVLSQTFKDFELILVDDGSPDNCGKICDSYAVKDNRIIVIHKENGGLSDARNAGIDISRGTYITFIDSDDYVDKNYLNHLLEALVNNHCDISVCNYKCFESDYISDISSDISLNIYDSLSYWEANFSSNIDVVAWGKLYKNNLFEGIRFPKGKIHEDEFLIHHLIGTNRRISVSSEVLYYYRQRRDSIMSTETDSSRLLTSLEYLLERTRYYYDNKQTKLFLKNYHLLFSKMINRYEKFHNNPTYKKVFQSLKKIYMKKKKSFRETLFFFSPKLYCFLLNIRRKCA